MLTPGGTTSTRQREALDAVEAELRAILEPYEDALETAAIYGMEVLRRPGAKAELRAILEPYEDALETAAIYGMEVLRRPGAKAHDWFAGVQQVNGVVKFNFLPMHANPELVADCSPELLKRRTGASVFKFTEPDDALMADLAALVARGFKLYAPKRRRR